MAKGCVSAVLVHVTFDSRLFGRQSCRELNGIFDNRNLLAALPNALDEIQEELAGHCLYRRGKGLVVSVA